MDSKGEDRFGLSWMYKPVWPVDEELKTGHLSILTQSYDHPDVFINQKS